MIGRCQQPFWRHWPKKRMDRQAGFTLIELLMAITILAIVLSGVYRVFAMGNMVHERGSDVLDAQAQLQTAMTRLSQDFRNAVTFSTHPFEGKQDFVSFTSLQVAPAQGHALPGVSQVTYEQSRDGVVRRVWSLASHSLSGNVLLPSPWRMSIQYLVHDEDGDQWLGEWDNQGPMPLAVKVRLSGEGLQPYTIHINLPQGKEL